MESFFDMGGYAAFIWPAFGLTFVVMAAMAVFTLRNLRARQRELVHLEAAGGRRARQTESDTGSETGNDTGGEQRGVKA